MKNGNDVLIRSKALSLIEKTKERILQFDSSKFPTPSTEAPRKLILKILESLGRAESWISASPEVLYHCLIHLQVFVSELEESTTSHISWPLVSYCDHIWKLLFPNDTAQIFYTVTSEHNYVLSPFSNRCKKILSDVFTDDQISKIFQGEEVYCLKLPSLEEENLPLYANIGHEFGHALIWSDQQKLFAQMGEFDAILNSIHRDLLSIDKITVGRRHLQISFFLKSVVTELYCDIVGCKIAGAAFFLSLKEMAWGISPNVWPVKLQDADCKVLAYPSWDFRLKLVRKWIKAEEFKTFADKAFQVCKNPSLQKIAECLTTEFSSGLNDNIDVDCPSSDLDKKVIGNALEKHIEDIKRALELILDRFFEQTEAIFNPITQLHAPSADDVGSLLHRLEYDILPNIIPVPHTLLGKAATFSSILNASALYRIKILSESNSETTSKEVSEKIQKLERLTAKSFEVSYIQQQYNQWQEKAKK